MARPLGSRVHALLDYPVALALIAVPFLLDLERYGEAAAAVPVVIGALLLVQATVTDYEFALEPAIPLPAHLAVDVVAGVALAASPWALGFADEGTAAWLGHVVAGAWLVAAGLLTRPVPERGATVLRLPPQPPLHLR